MVLTDKQYGFGQCKGDDCDTMWVFREKQIARFKNVFYWIPIPVSVTTTTLTDWQINGFPGLLDEHADLLLVLTRR